MAANNPLNDIKIPKQRIDSLQALRAFAFLGIFALHANLGSYGSWGVSVFVVLSGFLMSYTYISRDVDSSVSGCVKFGIKKIKKLYLLHIIMLVAVLAIIAAVGGSSVFDVLLNSKRDILLNLLLVQAWVPRSEVYFSLNSVAWYLSVSLFLYMMFPLVLGRIKRCKSILRAIFSMAAIFAVQGFLAAVTVFAPVPTEIFPNLTTWLTYVCPLFRLGDFAIGCWLGYIFVSNPLKLSAMWATVLEIFTFAALCVTQFIHEEQIIYIGGEWLRHNLLYLPTSLLLVYLFAVNKGWLTKLLTNKVTVFVGNISPYTFLIHAVAIIFVKNFLGCTVLCSTTAAMVLTSLVVTVVLAVLYMQLEKKVRSAGTKG